ncbi:hypothetical protein ANN_03458 [Periplaneta americana]|uniref:Uncharacterized protein n=1 Tax=Periplaneta americana TaxID=6978 RepID=A0ABQ8TZ13_PERAM|nr:hypothetical protein ANN_03458 [Periplaneta americana]
MRPRIRHRLPGIRLTVGDNLGKKLNQVHYVEDMNRFNKDMKASLICSSCKKFTEELVAMCADANNVCKGCKPNPEICPDCGGELPSHNKALEDNAAGPSNAGETEFTPSLSGVAAQNAQRNSVVNEELPSAKNKALEDNSEGPSNAGELEMTFSLSGSATQNGVRNSGVNGSTEAYELTATPEGSLTWKKTNLGAKLKNKPPGHQRRVRTPENVERVRQATLRSPDLSARRHSVSLGISNRTVRRILHDDLHLHPYKMGGCAEILCKGLPPTVNFAQEMLALHEQYENMMVTMSDEAHYHLNGAVNRILDELKDAIRQHITQIN